MGRRKKYRLTCALCQGPVKGWNRWVKHSDSHVSLDWGSHRMIHWRIVTTIAVWFGFFLSMVLMPFYAEWGIPQTAGFWILGAFAFGVMGCLIWLAFGMFSRTNGELRKRREEGKK